MSIIKDHLQSWEFLKTNGLLLNEKCFNYLIDNVFLGVKWAQEFFGEPVFNLDYLATGNLTKVCYLPSSKAIAIPIVYLNKIAEICNNEFEDLIRIRSKDSIDNKIFSDITFEINCLIIGIEETIHHYQNLGHSKVKVKLPKEFFIDYGYDRVELNPNNIIGKACLNFEVEARELTDIILKVNGKEPVWNKLNEYLKTMYLEFYNKGISDLILNYV